MNELDQYLDSLGLSAEDRTQVATTLAKAGDKATAPLLMRTDYTRKSMELAKERDRIATEQADLNKQLTSLNKQLETGSITAAKYRAKLEAINREWGEAVIDLKELDALPTPETPVRSTAPAFDPTPLENRLRTAEMNYGVAPEIAGQLLDLRAEYEEVFGSSKGFSAEKILKYARENKIPLRGERDPQTGALIGSAGAFEKLFKVPEKRHEILVKNITEEAERKAGEKFQQRMDAALAGNATGDRNPNSWSSGSHLLSPGFKQNQADRTTANAKEAGREAPPPPSESRSAASNELGGAGASFAKAFLARRAAGIGFGQEGKAA
jgi:hypothetical protein